MIARLICITAVFAATVAVAQAPDSSVRPAPRGGEAVVQPVEVAPSGEITRERRGLFKSIRPLFRSPKVEKEARTTRRQRAKGAVCGDVAIQGDAVGRVSGKIRGCGIENAVRVRSVSGVGLSTGATMDCTTAKALKTWMESAAKPSLSRVGGGLKTIRVAAHYACRTRNNQKGARLSEHGKGRAIDISGFTLRDGTKISVLQGWNNRRYAGALRRMHNGACGPFGTVLGPEANKFHRDHFHFDTARYRSGSYCR